MGQSPPLAFGSNGNRIPSPLAPKGPLLLLLFLEDHASVIEEVAHESSPEDEQGGGGWKGGGPENWSEYPSFTVHRTQ